MHENAAGYALYALDPAELREFEAHLAGCEFCQREVADFSRTAAELSLLTQATPSPRLRAKVLEFVRELPQLPVEQQANGFGPRTTSNGHTPIDTAIRPVAPRRAMPGTWNPDEFDSPAVDELAQRRQRRRRRILNALVAAVAILAVGLGGVIYGLVQQHQSQVADQKAQAAAKAYEEQLLRAEDAKVIVAPTLQGGGRCTFIVSKKLNRALYLGTNMPDPGQGRHYQLWTVTGTKSKNAPKLDNPVPSVRPWRQYFRGDVADADFLAVSIEADGTTPSAPTANQIIVVAPIT
jgi:anti-sigma factor RsiW